jgi:dsRNA-specific ribonuclease
VDGQQVASGIGASKKKAQEAAAQSFLEQIMRGS